MLNIFFTLPRQRDILMKLLKKTPFRGRKYRMFMEVIMKREQFGSRLGFILVSAGCAIGLGNVWKFPYMAGKYGGAAFILVYLLFLVILGLPIIVCEFSVGRASQKSIATSYNALEPPHTRWHYARWQPLPEIIFWSCFILW